MASTLSPRGFTLFETLIATGILVTALAGVAQLFVLSTRLTRAAGTSGLALVAAQDKLESLRGLAYAYGDAGQSITAPALQPSPPYSLAEDVAPYVDALDASANPVASEEGAAYVRRWRVTPIDQATPAAVVIEVCVFKAPAADRGAEACLATVRARQP